MMKSPSVRTCIARHASSYVPAIVMIRPDVRSAPVRLAISGDPPGRTYRIRSTVLPEPTVNVTGCRIPPGDSAWPRNAWRTTREGAVGKVKATAVEPEPAESTTTYALNMTVLTPMRFHRPVRVLNVAVPPPDTVGV